jgi:UDP-N-acetylmuramyl pentapeptide phosphotransferase/UDP-N-acetylglucosamine-1-phosphate transferase
MEGVGNNSAAYNLAPAVGIILAVLITYKLWGNSEYKSFYPYLISSLFLFSLSGYVDGSKAWKGLKSFVIQFSAAVVLMIGISADISNFPALLGMEGLTYNAAILLFSLFIVIISHAFDQLISVNHLSGGSAIIAIGVLGIWFWAAGFMAIALFSLIIAASIVGYIVCRANIEEMKLDNLGWNGIGFVLAFLVVEFLLANSMISGHSMHIANGSNLVLSLLIIPVIFWCIDRVYIKINGDKSGDHPFTLVLNYKQAGMNENQISLIFWTINLVIIGIAYSTMHLSLYVQTAILLLSGMTYMIGIYKGVLFAKEASRKIPKKNSVWVVNWTKE